MNTERENFINKLNDFIVFTNKTINEMEIKSKYLSLVKDYHPDINNRIKEEILNEYMIIINNTYERILNNKKRNRNIINKKNDGFDLNIFTQLISKIVIFAKDNVIIDDPIFKEYIDLLILEIGKKDKEMSNVFSLLLSKEILVENKWKTKIFMEGLWNYNNILNNRYKEVNPNNDNLPSIKILKMHMKNAANSYLLEYKNYCKREDYKESIDIMIKWLNKMIKE